MGKSASPRLPKGPKEPKAQAAAAPKTVAPKTVTRSRKTVSADDREAQRRLLL